MADTNAEIAPAACSRIEPIALDIEDRIATEGIAPC